MTTLTSLTPLARLASLNMAMTTQRRRSQISPGISFLAGIVLAGIVAMVML